jgi:hypothetical protein
MPRTLKLGSISSTSLTHLLLLVWCSRIAAVELGITSISTSSRGTAVLLGATSSAVHRPLPAAECLLATLAMPLEICRVIRLRAATVVL